MKRGLLIALVSLLPLTVSAQRTGELPAVFDGVGIEEQLGSTLPLDLQFADAEGNPVTLGRYFTGSRPVMLNLVYHECPMLCSLMLTEFTKTLIDLNESEGWVPGQQFDVVTISFSAVEVPEMAARAKARYLDQLGLEQAARGWHFLTGSQESIDAISEAMGYGFKWVEASQEYAHPAALMLASPEGVLTRYIHGLTFEARDVKLAVIEASEGRVGTAMDKIFLFCYRYDSQANSYVADAWAIMRAGGLLTMILLGGTLLVLWRRERRTLDPGSPAVST
ncbi:MAG: SCO family protein [Rhodothermales bacterium]|nr:SCO family protein [Rhodothermales bacterium]MBO6779167.1 SCO family protein [Rhodothermales bacterium]